MSKSSSDKEYKVSLQEYGNLLQATKQKKLAPLESYLNTGTPEEKSEKLVATLRHGYTNVTTVFNRPEKSGEEEIQLNYALFKKLIEIAEKDGILISDKDSTSLIDRMLRDIKSFENGKNDITSQNHPLFKMATKFLAFQDKHGISDDVLAQSKKLSEPITRPHKPNPEPKTTEKPSKPKGLGY